MDRWCAMGNHVLPIERFAVTSSGKPARDCRGCRDSRAAAIRRKQLEAVPFSGVDIDAIHYKRGAERGWKRT